MPILLLLIAFAFLFPTSVHANTVQITPAYVDVTLGEQQSQQQFEIFVTNKTKQEISLELSSLDFKQDDPNGIATFLGKEITSYSYALSSFLSFESTSLELRPGERRPIEVTVHNRQDLSPGGHYAAIIVKQRASEGREETVITPAVSSLVYLIKAGGERYNLSFKSIQFPKFPIVFSYPSTYLMELQNDGNIHLIPYGRADVTDIFGRLIHKGIINEPSVRVFPQSRRLVPIYSKKVSFSLPVSINKLTIEGRDSGDKVKFGYQDYFLYINPLVFPFILVPVGYFIYRKRKNKDV